jgi:hypothetical protein
MMVSEGFGEWQKKQRRVVKDNLGIQIIKTNVKWKLEII